MFDIKELTAGTFIEIEGLFIQINEEETEQSEKDNLALNFLVLLLGAEKINKLSVKDIEDVTISYISQSSELKSNYEWIYNPPQLPTSAEQTQSTIGDEMRREFAEKYSGYPMLIYLIANTFKTTPPEVWKWNLVDFLFWAEFLTQQKAVENIK